MRAALTILFLSCFIARAQTYPAGQLLDITPNDVFDLTCAGKQSWALFDRNLATPLFQNYFYGFILNAAGGQIQWIALDSFVNHPRLQVHNTGSGGPTVYWQMYYDVTDTTRHSLVYSGPLPSAGWGYIDSTDSRTYSAPARLIKLWITDGSATGFTEVRVYGNRLNPAPSIRPNYVPPPADPGKRFQGYGKLYVDSTMDDAGWTQRRQADMSYIDTSRKGSDGKIITLNKFENTVNSSYAPSLRAGLIMWPYFAGPRPAFKYPPHYDNHSKDMPIGADSTSETAWQPVYNTYYGLAAKLGHNTSASLTGYTFQNTNAGAGLGLIEEIEIGNEDDANWVGILRFHSPTVQMLKIKRGYQGAKAADPNIKVISGALVGINYDRLRALYFAHLLRYGSRDFPADAIAINEYCTTGGGQGGSNTDGNSPEQFRLYERQDSATRLRDQFFPGRKIYCTESGYDTHDGSNYNVPDVPGQTRRQTQAYWTMRCMEITAAAKWDKYMQYTARDAGGGDFATTGYSIDTFISGTPRDVLPPYMQQFVDPRKWVSFGVYISLPKELYWHMVLRARLIKDYKAWPVIIQRADSTGIWVLRYPHLTDPNKFLYSFWYGTRSSRTGTHTITHPGVTTAYQHHAKIGSKDGDTTVVMPSGNSLLVRVDESVQYMEVITVSNGEIGHRIIKGRRHVNKIKKWTN